MITLVLDNIRSMHNVGSIMRTADGFGIEAIICVGITPYTIQDNDMRLPHVQRRAQSHIAKTALGAEESVNCIFADSIETALKGLTGPVIGLEQTPSSIPLTSYIAPTTNFTLIVGNEPNGLSEAALRLCDQTIEIAMYGKKESLNVSVATGIALYALTTQTA